MSKVEHKTSTASEPALTARFATKRAGSKAAKAAQTRPAVTRAEPAESLERIGKGKDVIFSGAWKPGRVLSSK